MGLRLGGTLGLWRAQAVQGRTWPWEISRTPVQKVLGLAVAKEDCYLGAIDAVRMSWGPIRLIA